MSVFLAYYQQSDEQLEIEAVIYAQQVDFRSEPNLRSEVIVQLHEGTKLAVIEQIEQWAHVRLANGSMGWLPIESVEKIVF
jgi:SH3-like domain-containing protein